MNLIKAFVGHSFTDEDSEVVEKFLKFFSRLEKMNDGFSWVHAEAAEPRQLADKVMTLMHDRNLFIGICTRKELTVAPVRLSAIPLLNLQIANSADLQWKTSDWIIQEIGLAKGRELEILLLIEEGVRKPGGLQGDVEYIPFERSTPEASFGKIIEMITALSPKTTGALTVSSAQTSPLPIKESEIASAHDSWTMPSISWGRDQYEFAMFHFILEKDDVGAKRIDEAFLARPEAQDPENVAAWKAHNHCFRLIFGKGGDLKALDSLASEFPNNSAVHEFRARALARFEKHLDAASEYEIAADKTESMEDKARLWGSALEEYVTEEKLHEASIIVGKLRRALHSSAIDEVQFLTALRQPLEVTKDRDLLIAISERLVDLSPDDFRTRFSLAYMQSEAGNDDLSLNHYLKVPPGERGAMHWNNLGVQFDHFKLPAKAVQAFRKSEEMNETLAMANLGYKMLRVGLLSEAQAVCEKALATKDYHKNVGQLLVKLKNVPAEEDTALEEVLEKSKLKIDFYRGFGRAIGLPEPKTIEGTWVGPECPVDLRVVGGQVEITGNYEQPANPFAFATGMLSVRRVERRRVEYRGTLKGRAIQAVVKRSGEEDSAAKTLLSFPDEGKALLYISDDETEISMIENPSGPYPKITVMKRSPAPALLTSPA